MSLDLENKFLVLEYDSSRVDPGPALILFRVKDSKLITEYHPHDWVGGQLDMGECEAVRQYLQNISIREVYSSKDLSPMPESI